MAIITSPLQFTESQHPVEKRFEQNLFLLQRCLKLFDIGLPRSLKIMERPGIGGKFSGSGKSMN